MFHFMSGLDSKSGANSVIVWLEPIKGDHSPWLETATGLTQSAPLYIVGTTVQVRGAIVLEERRPCISHFLSVAAPAVELQEY